MSRNVSVAEASARFSPAKRRMVAMGLLAAGLVLLVSSAELHAWLTGFLPAAESIIRHRPVLGVSIFVLYGALSAMLAFVSSALIVPVGVYVWGSGASLLLLWVAWILGGVSAYTISRCFGRPVVQALHSGPALERYEHRISHQAPFGLVLLFQLGVPSEIPGYLLGLVRYPFWKYLGALALAELPYAVATIYLGESFIERRIPALVAVAAAVAALSGWALHAVNRKVLHGHSATR